MKWITMEEQCAETLSERYAYCEDDYYIFKENADEPTLERAILSKYKGHIFTPDDIFESKETGWYWIGDCIIRVANVCEINEYELITVRNFVLANKLDL